MPVPQELGLIVDGLDELEAERARRKGGRLQHYFVDCTKKCKPRSRRTEDHKNLDGSQRYCRVLYVKHIQHIDAGAEHRERVLMAGNRIGKSDTGAIETTYHLTGKYPNWWKGHRFDEPTRGWACGKLAKTVREIMQVKLLGPIGFAGAGFIPWRDYHHSRAKRGEPDAIDRVWVRHVSGGLSVCQFKAYEEKRKSFEGTSQHFIWMDEEPPIAIYSECLLRTMKTSDFPGGIMYATFTPLDGMTELIETFMPDGTLPPNGVVNDKAA